MADIFLSKPGQVSVISDPYAVPAVVRIKSQSVDFNPQAVILTSLGYSQRTKQRFSPSLSDAIYVYIFGDAMGQIEVSGLAFSSRCGQYTTTMTGMEEVMRFYEQARISKSQEMIYVAIGSILISGFLTQMTMTMSKSDQPFLMTSFTYGINTLPRDT